MEENLMDVFWTTSWYPPEIKPAHPGIYLVVHELSDEYIPVFSYFDGQLWYAGRVDKEAAVTVEYASIHQDKYWQGIYKQEGSIKC